MKVHWSRPASEDVANIWTYHSAVDPDHAERVQDLIDRAVERLGSFPGLGRPSGIEDTHLWSIPTIGYIVEYEVDVRRVLILHVWHARQSREKP